VTDAQATSAALDQQVQVASLNPMPVDATIQVDLNGVVAGDDDAVEAAISELDDAFGTYLNGQDCRIGFVLISSRSNELGQGVDLSNAIANIIEEEFPEILPESTDGSSPGLLSESIALPGTSPVGEVQLKLLLSSGCQPAGG
jgi:hypothetical protein